MIKVRSSSTPRDVEEVLDQLRNSVGQALQLPTTLPLGGAFGLSALLLQLVAKWYQVNQRPRALALSRDFASNPETRDRVASTVHGLAGLYFCDLISAGDEEISRVDGLQSMAKYVLAMASGKYQDTTRGTGTLLCCFQGVKPENEYLSSLYAVRERGRPASEDTQELITVHNTVGFSHRLREILSIYVSGIDSRFSAEALDVLGSLTYQLFKNADVHTVKDQNNNDYARSVRGLLVRHIVFQSFDQISDYVCGDNNLRVFLTRTGTDKTISGKPSKAFLEISVFDTGPGLALRWLSATKHGGAKDFSDITLTQEFDAVAKCFGLHATTFPRGHHGDGLAIALQAFKQLSAFVSLRTGRLSLYQDFSRLDTASFQPSHRFSDRQQLSPTAGTSYVVCIPIPDR